MNKLVVAGLVILFMLIAIGLGQCSKDSSLFGPSRPDSNEDPGDHDTQNETLESLTLRINQYQAIAEQVRESLQKESQEKNQLRESLKQTNEQAKKTIEQLMQKINGLTENLNQMRRAKPEQAVKPTLAPMPVGSGIDNGVIGEDGYKWYRPIGSEVTDKAGGLLARLSSDHHLANGLLRGPGYGSGFTRDKPAALPAYTVPANATLMGSRGMTALVGRVPLKGVVKDPMPFKVITGAQNLMANDQSLPEIEKMIWSGTAIGDAVLKCVRGKVTSVTFVFADGGILTQESDTSEPLGWLSDDHGYPCIPGQYVTNAPEFLSSMFAAGAASGAADAFAASQTTTTVTANGVNTALTGDARKYALGRGGATGFREVSKYIIARMGDMFDAVVVQPGHQVAIHVSKSIHIDYDPQGRKLRHVAAQNTQESLD